LKNIVFNFTSNDPVLCSSLELNKVMDTGSNKIMVKVQILACLNSRICTIWHYRYFWIITLVV